LPPSILKRAWYHAPIADFVAADPLAVLGALAANSTFADLDTQKGAWKVEITELQNALRELPGWVFFEFVIPRMGRRIDAVVLSGPVVFAIEFKVGEHDFLVQDIEQVWDYALDLKNFHEASHALTIVPILVATEAPVSEGATLVADRDGVYRPIRIRVQDLRATLDGLLSRIPGATIESSDWAQAPYRPTPTIIEAARALYAQHSVEEIARHDAEARNLTQTKARLEQIIAKAKHEQFKAICFVTGVPGAGKTLVGLDVATHERDTDVAIPSVFLSGNGPLVAVLQEALARDKIKQHRSRGEKLTKKDAAKGIKSFIQIVHHFRDEALIDRQRPPAEHVAIFDEAQRAWNLRKTADFMQRKKKVPDFNQSESEFLIAYLDRHRDWAVVVCLVGGGQEIHDGEAGIDAWIDAINAKFPNWHVYISPRLTDSEYAAGRALAKLEDRPNTHRDESLHLSVSMRSFRAEHVSSFVKSVLDLEAGLASDLLTRLNQYPIAVTRNLSAAKQWVRAHARGSERFGLVASSKAMRLKPHAIDIRVSVDPVHWFLNDRHDTRSSYYLEDVATEFQVQGLELDWTCVSWDGDLRHTSHGWSHHDFTGSSWKNIHSPENRRYLLNAYRVLLTRARQGMVIFVPEGDPADPTRKPEFYDGTFGYLKGLGLPVLA
jgi:hypothetical protein